MDTDVDPAVWLAIAGASVHIPSVNSRVYYFPQGHLEHLSPNPNAADVSMNFPVIQCNVLSVRFLSGPPFEQVFAKIVLQPVQSAEPENDNGAVGDNGGGDVVAFSKVLTPSDANNGGGFSVPKSCADSVLPRLDFSGDDTPVQNLVVKDTLGTEWKFRHIYRGTPRRHLLTTGWSKYVNSKQLVAGDTVVFMRKKSSGELFIGVRQANRRFNIEEDGNDNGVAAQFGGENGGLNMSQLKVMKAVKMAVTGAAFEVVYYPVTGLPDFVVSAERVEEAMRVGWCAGMRVKMAVETEDSTRMNWNHGTVSEAIYRDTASPWRMLQVTWDEPKFVQNANRVSPWQVEFVHTTPQLDPAFPPFKKFKDLQHPGMTPDGEGEFYYPSKDFQNSMLGNPLAFCYSSSATGMQGARLDPASLFCLSDPRFGDFFQTSTGPLLTDHVKDEKLPGLESVSTVLNIGSMHSDNLSPHSQNSVDFSSMELLNQQGLNAPAKVGVNSFQLFGKIIQMAEPSSRLLDDNLGGLEVKRDHVYKEIDDVDN